MTDKKRSHIWRQTALLVFFLGFSALIIAEFSGGRDLLNAITISNWYWLVAAAAILAFSFYLHAVPYRVGLLIVQVRAKALALAGHVTEEVGDQLARILRGKHRNIGLQTHDEGMPRPQGRLARGRQRPLQIHQHRYR